jgi:hypothetical protein
MKRLAIYKKIVHFRGKGEKGRRLAIIAKI